MRRRRDHVRPGDRAPRLRRRGRVAGRRRPGVTLRYTEQRPRVRAARQRTRLVDAMAKAVEWYHQRLLTGPDAGAARGYLRDRGARRRHRPRLQHRVGARRVGRAGAGACGFPTTFWTDTGLGFLNRGGRQTDAFRGRVLFPIFDAQGDPVAFGGRSLPGADGPKYKNSPETPIYSKSQGAVRAQLGQGRRGRGQPGGGVRGLHRRDRLRPQAGCRGPWPPAGRR